MGQIFFAGEKPHERPALLRHMVTDGSAQHRIARLKRVEDRALRDWTLKLKLHLTVATRQRPQMGWEIDSDHGSV
jgi:hypothetical protein